MTTTDHAAALAAAIRDADIHRFCCTDAQRSALAAYEASIAPDPYALLRTAARADLQRDAEAFEESVAFLAREQNRIYIGSDGAAERLRRAAQLLRAILALADRDNASAISYITVGAHLPLGNIAAIATEREQP